MSAWRMYVRDLYANGPQFGSAYYRHAIRESRVLGLVEQRGYRGRWQLTPLGIAYCEGRAAQSKNLIGGRVWHATWLAALPRNVNLKDRYDHQTIPTRPAYQSQAHAYRPANRRTAELVHGQGWATVLRGTAQACTAHAARLGADHP